MSKVRPERVHFGLRSEMVQDTIEARGPDAIYLLESSLYSFLKRGSGKNSARARNGFCPEWARSTYLIALPWHTTSQISPRGHAIHPLSLLSFILDNISDY